MIFEGQPLYTTGEKYFIDLVLPPIVLSIWWLRSRGAAKTFEGTVSERTKKREKRIFFIALITAWILMFSGTTYLTFFAKPSSGSTSMEKSSH